MNKTDSGIRLNIRKICRICLIEANNMRSVFSKLDETEILEVNICSLSDVLAKLTDCSVWANDGYPTLICMNCVLLIHAAYKFKIQFEHSQQVLQKYLEDCAKQDEQTNPENINDFEYTDNCDSETSETEDYSKRRTRQSNRQKINKRHASLSSSQEQSKRRSRKPKLRAKIVDEDSDDEEEDLNGDRTVLHPCPVCTKEFTAEDLREHAHTHKALKKYLNIPTQYKVAPTSRFYKKCDQQNITVGLHNQKIKLHKCVECGKEFVANSLRIHLQEHRNQTEYQCKQCKRIFKKLNHLNTHCVQHLKERPFKCEQCGKGFMIKTNYECHMLTHNTNQELPHECTYCLKRFSNPEHLNRHLVIHTENVSYSVKYKVCKCHHCLKTFKNRSELKAHDCIPLPLALNTKYPCKICNKVFKNSNGLYNHTRNIHKLKGARVLCSVCGNRVSNIYNHMMRHTGEKPFQCNLCGKRFIGKPQLKQHLLVHSGLKPFVCSVCAKAFNNLYNLQVHERIHKGDRCHICTFCGKGFLEKSYLKKHMNVHARLN